MQNSAMPQGQARLGRRWEAGLDAVAVATIALTAVSMASGGPDAASSGGLAIGLLGASTLLLVLRRRYPMAAAIGVILTSGFALVVPSVAVAVWVLAEICLFSLPLRRSRRVTLVIAATHAAVLYTGAVVAFGSPVWDPLALILPVWTIAVVSFASYLRSQSEYVVALRQRELDALAARENEVRHHVDAERLRIARDLHDSVANSITVVNLESANARRHVRDAPELAIGSLERIRTATKATLTELADMLVVLRAEPKSSDRDLATVRNIPQLIDRLHDPARPISASLDALTGVTLHPAADAALFRIVQEGLTNARKHGIGSTQVRATTAANQVTIQLVNPVSHSVSQPGKGAGFGLIGMQERATSAGGNLFITSEPTRFSLRVTVPAITTTQEGTHA